MNDIAAITCFFNFEKDFNKLKDFIKFKETLEEQGVPLFVIEITVEGTIPVLRDVCDKDKYVTGKTMLPILIKGNALNVLSSHVPKEYKKIVWLNHNTIIVDENWAEKTARFLDDYKLVKIGNDPRHESPMAVRRCFFESVGLFDYDFCGNSNLIMFLSAINNNLLYNNDDLLELYQESNSEIFYRILSYKESCNNYFNKSVGYLDAVTKNISNHTPPPIKETINLLKNINVDFNIQHSGLHKLMAVKNIYELNYPEKMLSLLKNV